MNNEKYFIVFFDHKNLENEEEIVKATIDRLWSYYYRNRAIRISWNVLLIKPSSAAGEQFPHLYIDEALSEQIQKSSERDLAINYFALPVNLSNLDSYLSNLRNEVEYLKQL